MLWEYRSDEPEGLRGMEGAYFSAAEDFRAKGAEIEVTPLGLRPCGEGVDPTAQKALSDWSEALLRKHTGGEIGGACLHRLQHPPVPGDSGSQLRLVSRRWGPYPGRVDRDSFSGDGPADRPGRVAVFFGIENRPHCFMRPVLHSSSGVPDGRTQPGGAGILAANCAAVKGTGIFSAVQELT